jgi:hypothetical protein
LIAVGGALVEEGIHMQILKIFLAAFVLLAVGTAGAIAQTAPATAPSSMKMPPVPDPARLKDANAIIDEIFKADIKAAQTLEQKNALIEKLLDAAKNEQDSLARYALYLRVREIASAAGNFPAALLSIAAVEAEYDVDSIKLAAEAAQAASKTSRGAPQKRQLALAAQPVIDKALSADRFDVAASLVESALAAARLGEDAALTKQLTEKSQQVAAIAGMFAKIKPSLATLAAKPEDPTANFDVGQYHCFYRGKWAEGLPQLAKGNNAGYKALAEMELKKPAVSLEQVALADGWWEAAQKETGIVKNQLMIHAGGWYRLALPELSGLAKAKVDKRLSEISAPLTGVVVGGGAGSGAGGVKSSTTVVDLLSMFNQECVVVGAWELKDGTLVAGAEAGTRVEFPYEPPEEYDYRIVFSRTSGTEGIVQIVSAQGKSFVWAMGSKGNAAGGLGRINGADPVNNKSKVNLPVTQGQKYDSVVQVRKTGVRVLIDGKQVLDWKTDYADFSIFDGWKLRSNKTLGLGSWQSGVVYSKIEVVEVSGAGKVLK